MPGLSSTRESSTHRKDSAPRRIVVLGSTGSIGTNTLDVARQFPDRLQVVGLTAHSNTTTFLEQLHEFRPRLALLTDPVAARELDRTRIPPETELFTDPEAVAHIVADPEVDTVVSAIVGFAGLFGTWAALDAGKTVALANKETLVVAGPLVGDLLRRKGGRMIPVDSEHSAIFQALTGHQPSAVERLVLTGSGGPFRGKKTEDLRNVTVEQALAHPTWRMGRKITIDSATLMNKALEVIEARWLFDVTPEQIAIIIHPESMIHSFVEFRDGSVLAQISPPDMRLPIQYALLYPERVPGPARRVRWDELRMLRFEAPDLETFPAPNFGYEVARKGGTTGAILNAANEAAVAAFLEGEIAFLDIAVICREVLAHHDFLPQPSLDELMAADAWARREVARWIRLQRLSPTH